jgi:hypothetical protein
MGPNQEQFRLDVIAESSQGWRWQIFEGDHLILQSPAIYATRADASRAGILEKWELMTESERLPFDL